MTNANQMVSNAEMGGGVTDGGGEMAAVSNQNLCGDHCHFTKPDSEVIALNVGGDKKL